MKKDKKDKIDLGYDTSKIIFSIGTVVGLFDSDGSFRIRIRKSNEVLRRYALELVFTQQEENRDIADSLVKTIGFGRIYLTPTKGNRKPSVSLVLNFLTSVKESLCRNWLDPFPPLAAGKRRDYLISKILSDHQRKKYTSFSEFDSNVDLKRKNVSISVAEFRNLTPVERRKAGTIACLYLKSNLSPSINKPAKERKVRRLQLDNDINSLVPLNSTVSIGLRLGKYFLLDISREVKDLDKTLMSQDYTFFI